MTALQKKRKRPLKPMQVCPSCGYLRHLLELTGFCVVCTNEHERGGGLPRNRKAGP